MVTIYRGTIGHPIVFPESVIITPENLNFLDLKKIIYCEISPMGAMGNEGGILLYVLNDEGGLSTYETNDSIDKESYVATLARIDQHSDLFGNHNGGFGNHVLIKKGVQLEVDEKYKCFWFHSENTRLRIDSSVEGVFIRVALEIKNKIKHES